jgi:hypothetical protein
MPYGTLAIDSITPSANALSVTGSISAVNTFGFENRFINGGLSVDQRNSGAAQTITAAAALAYTVDRWYAYCTGANVTGQQIAGTFASSQYRYQFTGAASVTTIGFGQRIEQLNCYDLANTTATLSCYISNSLLTTVTWTAYYANTANTFGSLASPTVTQIATGTFTVTSSRAQYSAQISIPSAATTGIQIVFTVGAQTSGTWVVDTIQLEKGTQATSFDFRAYTTELQLCQRYCWRPTIGTDSNSFISTAGAFGSATNGFFSGSYPVTMRATPTVTTDTATLSNYAAYTPNGGVFNALTSLSLNTVSNASMYLLNFGIASGGSAGQFVWFSQRSQTTFGVFFSAELI